MRVFDKTKVKANFNHFAKNYNSLANLQKQVAVNLTNFANLEIQESQKILDLGSGSGFIGQNIIKNGNFSQKELFQLDISQNMLLNNPNKGENIFNIIGDIDDIENLKLKENYFDLAISSLAFQWVGNLDKLFRNIQKILKSESYFTFSIFIDGTLEELKKSAKNSQINLSVNDFISKKHLKTLIFNNFSNHEIKLENIKLYHDNIFQILHYIKDIGASYSNKKSKDKALTKQDFANLNKFYLKNFNNGAKLASSWQVAYVKIKL